LRRDNEQIMITAVPARHAHDDQLNEEMGIVNGYVIKYSNDNLSFNVYWTGDTVWFDGLNAINEMIGRTHLLIPHMGAVGVDGPFGRLTLDANEATKIACLFKPDFIIPIHHHTFTHYVEPISIFQSYMRETNYADHLHILKEGESWYY
jgi:N-acyl-phosphatidylethanolamine-hydrolysing phospholipase D